MNTLGTNHIFMIHSTRITQRYWPLGSRDEDFEGVLPYVGMSVILVM